MAKKGDFGKMRGLGQSSGESVGNSREQGLSPQRSYEPTGSIPTPSVGGRSRMTRNISGPQGGGNNQAGFTPENQRGPSKGG